MRRVARLFIVALAVLLVLATGVPALAFPPPVGRAATYPYAVVLQNVQKGYGTGVYVINVSEAQVSGSSDAYVMGEVFNNTGAPIFAATVEVVCYVGSSEMGVWTPFGAYQYVPAGATSPFSELMTVPQGCTSYRERVRDYMVTSIYSWTHVFSFSNLDSRWSGSDVLVTGTVKNEASFSARYVEIVSACYDPGGRVVGLGTNYSPNETLSPGQQITFIVTTVGPLLPSASRCLVGAEGQY